MALMLLGSTVTSDCFLDKKTIFCSFLNTKWLSGWDPYTDLYLLFMWDSSDNTD